jgi:hypothetical protein
MEHVQNFLTAIFAEGAFTLIWIGLLITSTRDPKLISEGLYGFLRNRLSESLMDNRGELRKTWGVAQSILLIVTAYPIGIIVQRISDEHI